MTSDLKNSKPEGQIILKWSNKSKFNILEYSEAEILSETMSEIMTSELKKNVHLRVDNIKIYYQTKYEVSRFYRARADPILCKKNNNTKLGAPFHINIPAEITFGKRSVLH